ncbi:MAG: Lrp/AsnC family transcriptional regulator [Gammaproteobacteria bacterium]|nr:Lrp/AsnC family transcriptional regulator [Gammaproteobacteria bacterium]
MYFKYQHKERKLSYNHQKSRTKAALNEVDRKILQILQHDATKSLDQVAKKIGLSKTALWNRIQRLQQEKIILKQAVFVDPIRVGLNETFFVVIKTSEHDADWLKRFNLAVKDMPEIMEAHRLAGDMDYILKVQVESTRAYDEFYKRLIAKVSMNSVTACLSMETMKHETVLPL